jgi:hypothetical protein
MERMRRAREAREKSGFPLSGLTASMAREAATVISKFPKGAIIEFGSPRGKEEPGHISGVHLRMNRNEARAARGDRLRALVERLGNATMNCGLDS